MDALHGGIERAKCGMGVAGGSKSACDVLIHLLHGQAEEGGHGDLAPCTAGGRHDAVNR